MDSKIVYVGVDFGTAGTGCAIGTNAKGIYEYSWARSENRVGSDKSKTRTAVLVNAADYSPVAFGDEAYDIYEQKLLADPEKTRKELLFFDYFKMSLSVDEKTGAVNRHPTVTAVTGETAPAAKIFAAAFRSIHESIFARLTQASSRTKPCDITWIITVPTMWSEAAKQIMREAARAGFRDTLDSQIKIALEPEAAALCCRAQQLGRQLSLSSPNASLSDLLQVGSNFIVADLGAGTADFSQLSVATDGTIVETAASSGGPWGGHLVEKRLLDIFEGVFGAETMLKFRKSNPVEYHELELAIHNLKHRVDPAHTAPQRLALPFAFIEAVGLRQRLSAHTTTHKIAELPINFRYAHPPPQPKLQVGIPQRPSLTLPVLVEDVQPIIVTAAPEPVLKPVRGQHSDHDQEKSDKNDQKTTGKTEEDFQQTTAEDLKSCAAPSPPASVTTVPPVATAAAAAAVANALAAPVGQSKQIEQAAATAVSAGGIGDPTMAAEDAERLMFGVVFDNVRTMTYTSGGFLKLSHAFVMSLFDGPKNAIVDHLNKMLDANPQATTLFLVGGFSESLVIQQAIDNLLANRDNAARAHSAANTKSDEKYDTKMNLSIELSAAGTVGSVGTVGTVGSGLVPVRVLPTFPGLCVMNGAVHFGLNPHLISQRISKMSFGIECTQAWDDKLIGRSKESRILGGKEQFYCSKTFSQFCQVGELISVDQAVTRKFQPSADRQESVILRILATPKKNVKFSDDDSVTVIGAVTLLIPIQKRPSTLDAKHAPSGGKKTDEFGLDRDIVVSMKFGCTEINITAYEALSGNSIECVVDCLDFDLDASAAKLSRRS